MQWRKWLFLSPVIILAAAGIAAGLAGCGIGDIAGPPSDEAAGVRLTGGSIPGGEKVQGVVVDSDGDAGVRSSDGDDYDPAVDANVDLTGQSGESIHTATGDDGWFGFDDPPSGRCFIAFDLDEDSQSTDVNVNPRGSDRVQLIARLLSPSEQEEAGRRRHNRVRLHEETEWMSQGDEQSITAAIDGYKGQARELVWVMQTRIDAQLLPTGTPNVARLVAGSESGVVWLHAQLSESKSKKIKITIVGSGHWGWWW